MTREELDRLLPYKFVEKSEEGEPPGRVLEREGNEKIRRIADEDFLYNADDVILKLDQREDDVLLVSEYWLVEKTDLSLIREQCEKIGGLLQEGDLVYIKHLHSDHKNDCYKGGSNDPVMDRYGRQVNWAMDTMDQLEGSIVRVTESPCRTGNGEELSVMVTEGFELMNFHLIKIDPNKFIRELYPHMDLSEEEKKNILEGKSLFKDLK